MSERVDKVVKMLLAETFDRPLHRQEVEATPLVQSSVAEVAQFADMRQQQLQATIPDNLRITAVRPKIDPRRGIVLTIAVVARGVDDVDELMQKLEQTGAFNDLITPEEHVNEQGELEAAIETRYQPLAPTSQAAQKEGGKQP